MVPLLKCGTTNFYPRPPRGGRLRGRPQTKGTYAISIHALREEGDNEIPVFFKDNLRFLSTPSARRATIQPGIRGGPHHDFYPRPPRGGRHFVPCPHCGQYIISIHALREEGDWAL